MKKILLLMAVVFATVPFLAQADVSIKANDGGFEVKSGNPDPPPNPQVIVVRPAPQVVEKTTVVQPTSSGGCALQPGF